MLQTFIGLSEDQVKAGQEKHGPNELPEEEGATIWDLFLEQFDDPLVKILLGAAVVSFVSPPLACELFPFKTLIKETCPAESHATTLF